MSAKSRIVALATRAAKKTSTRIRLSLCGKIKVGGSHTSHSIGSDTAMRRRTRLMCRKAEDETSEFKA